MYRHHFSHHFDFFILVWPQRKFCKTSYVGCLYSTFRCLHWFFCDFLLCIHSFQVYTRTWLYWRPKLSLFIPVGTEPKIYQQCACLSESHNKSWCRVVYDFNNRYYSVYKVYLCVVEHRIAIVTSLGMWLCTTAKWVNTVIRLSKFLLPSILLWISVTNMVICARIDGPYGENALKMNGGPLKKQNLAQKWKHHIFIILQVCTNSPATTSCQSSLQKWDILLGMTEKKFREDWCNIGGLVLWVWKVTLLW